MDNKHFVNAVSSGIALMIVCWTAAYADSVHGIQVLKISPQDKRAVIMTADGKTQVIKKRDVLISEAFSVQSSQFKSEDKKQLSPDSGQ